MNITSNYSKINTLKPPENNYIRRNSKQGRNEILQSIIETSKQSPDKLSRNNSPSIMSMRTNVMPKRTKLDTTGYRTHLISPLSINKSKDSLNKSPNTPLLNNKTKNRTIKKPVKFKLKDLKPKLTPLESSTNKEIKL